MTKLTGKAKSRANKKKRNQQKNDFFLRRKKLIGEIRKYDDPALFVKCDEAVKGEDVKSIFKKMVQVLNAAKYGVGLAASQIGVTKNIVIIKPSIDSNAITCMINPEIESTSGKKKLGREMCLSYPNVSGFIERYTSVEVSYYDENWKKHTVEYEEGNILGIIVQHEISHLTHGHCEIYDWWKDPEGMKKKLEERLKKPEEKKSKYEVVESEDLKKEKEKQINSKNE